MSNLGDIFQQRYNTNTNNTSVSVSKNTNTKTKTLAQVQLIADKLEATLGKQVPSRYEYYCKLAWHLPEHIIWYCLDAEVENRRKGKAPHKLFSYLTAQYMK